MLWLIVRFEFEGIHNWKEAPDEVSFLRNPHRHIFKCEVWIEQFHNDRELEYFIVKRKLQSKSYLKEIGNSCEMIAERISEEIPQGRKYKIFVFEDGENGTCLEG